MLRDKRRSLRAMLDELANNGTPINGFFEDDQDKETTLFDAVKGLFDEVFEKELQAEEREAIEESHKEDEKWEEFNGRTI